MSTTYDWSPVFGQNGAISNYLQNMLFQKQLGGMFGQEQLPGAPGMQASIPTQPQMVGYGGGSIPIGDQKPQAYTPPPYVPGLAQPSTLFSKTNPGYVAPPVHGGPISVGGGNIDVSTPAIAPQTTYSGPVGQALGDQQSSALLPLFQALGPRALPLLMQTVQGAMQHKQDIEDRRITPLSSQEAQAAGLRAGGVYGRDVSGNLSTIQASDMHSPGAMQQQQDEAAFTNQLPMTPAQKAQNAIARQNANTQAGELGEKRREFDASNPMGASGAGGFDLNSAPVATQNTVRAMLEGRMAPPTGMALRTPYWQNMMALANTADPTFDQTVWAGRFGTRKDVMGGGKTYQMLNSGNTAIQHLGRLNDQIPTVSGIQFPFVGNMINSGVNAAELGSGHVGVNTYNDTLGHVSEETTKFYRMTGGNEADIQRTMTNLAPNLSTAQKKDGVANTVHLIFGALQPKVEQYNKIMGTDFPVSHFLSSKSIATMKKMGFDPDTGEALAPQSAPGNGWSIKVKGQ